MPDPYFVQVDTAELADLGRAFDVVDQHAELDHRYRKMLADSQRTLTAAEVRLTQARGLAKRLLVLIKAAGPDFPDALPAAARTALDAGSAQANALIFDPEQA
ncbi:hypothetical protein SAMN05421805_108254 [Saccharopolyspora antimicrobica]|uniref:Uncharacterized protein n=1 Tax=Saccharopolyspora antimicrobica TaxID=455193 RepID=A0A1I5DSD9_9PSEU|nr:hypothetical protein [Saccharopolyspora antimicrobica]RKT85003.1 hypothetical protein ATL45_3336 [Saccharopolyspora antimicrobica]SFO02162.1 hypothetical protein SAMN05421805_108254 [Saccharopolyspora antimicrobica]